MPKMHLRQPRFRTTCGSFTSSKKRTQKLQKNRRFKIYLSKRTR